jgi:hypothetical protein
MRMEVEIIDDPEKMQVDDLENDMDPFEEDNDADEDEEGISQKEINDQMMEKLMNESRIEMDHYIRKQRINPSLTLSLTMEGNKCVIPAPFQRPDQMGSQSYGNMESASSQYNAMSLSDRQQTNQFHQGRQVREIQRMRDMNNFLDELDQEIEDAAPATTKKKYKPIQDDFQVIKYSFFVIFNRHRLN